MGDQRQQQELHPRTPTAAASALVTMPCILHQTQWAILGHSATSRFIRRLHVNVGRSPGLLPSPKRTPRPHNSFPSFPRFSDLAAAGLGDRPGHLFAHSDSNSAGRKWPMTEAKPARSTSSPTGRTRSASVDSTQSWVSALRRQPSAVDGGLSRSIPHPATEGVQHDHALDGARPGSHLVGVERDRSAAQQHRPRAAGRTPRVCALLVRRAPPQSGGRRHLTRRTPRADRRRDLDDPARFGCAPNGAPHGVVVGGGVRSAGRRASRAIRPRPRPLRW